MKFTNKMVEKERKKKKVYLIIGVLLLVISVIFLNFDTDKEKDVKKINSVHDVIVSNEGNKANKNAYIDINTVPYKFAVTSDTTDAYYFVSDDKYMYVIYMGETRFNALDKENIKEVPIHIEGVTKKVPNDVKKIAIKVYNRSLEEEKLTLADFDNYFGSVYLDTTISNSSSGAGDLFVLFGIFGTIFIIVYLIINFRFKKGIKRLTDNEIMKIDSEMNASDAFYYEKAHLYLTDNYIINFSGSFKAINYADIVWMYPFVMRTNGIKTSQSIIVVTNDGKKHNIANIDIITKKKEKYIMRYLILSHLKTKI